MDTKPPMSLEEPAQPYDDNIFVKDKKGVLHPLRQLQGSDSQDVNILNNIFNTLYLNCTSDYYLYIINCIID